MVRCIKWCIIQRGRRQGPPAPRRRSLLSFPPPTGIPTLHGAALDGDGAFASADGWTGDADRVVASRGGTPPRYVTP